MSTVMHSGRKNGFRLARIYSIVLGIIFCFYLLATKQEDNDNLLIRLSLGQAGTLDYSAFWSAYQSFLAGKNPFDPAEYCPIQYEIRKTTEACIPFRSPPWIFPLLAPVLSFPFFTSAAFFLITNIAFAVGAGELTARAFGKSKTPSLTLLISSLLFLPHFNTLFWGQLGLLITFALSGLIWSIRFNKPIIAAICIILASIKPHPIYLIFIALPFILFRADVHKGFSKRLFKFGALFFVVLCGAVILRNQNIFMQWLQSFASVDPFDLKKPVLGDFIRTRLGGSWLGNGTPNLIVSLITVIGLIYYITQKRVKKKEIFLLCLLPLSLFTAPYAWLHDFSTLMLLPAAALGHISHAQISNEKRKVITFVTFALQAVVIILGVTIFSKSDEFIFLPILYLFYCLFLKYQLAHEVA